MRRSSYIPQLNRSVSNSLQSRSLSTSFSPYDESLVNTYTSNSQMSPAITLTPSGGYAIAWQSSGQDGSGNGIYVQVYDSTGTYSGSEFVVNTYTSGDQVQPDIGALRDGRLVIAWSSNGQDGSDWGVYLAIYNPNGTPYNSMTNVQVNELTSGDQSQAAVAVLANGNFVVVYHSNGGDGNSYGICGKIYNSDGTVYKSEFVINSITTGKQMYPAIAAFSDGTFIVTWQDNSGGNFDIRARIFGVTGTAISGADFLVNTYTTSDQTYAAIGVALDNSYVIAWQSAGQSSYTSAIYFQRYSAGSTTSGSETLANTYTSNGQYNAAVAAVSASGFIISWESKLEDGSGNGVFAQRFTSAGAKKGTEFQINTNTIGDQASVRVVQFQYVGYVFTWQSNNQDFSANGVYSTIFLDCDAGSYQYGQTCVTTCPAPYYAADYRCQSFSTVAPYDETQVNTYTLNNQNAPAVTTTANGGYAITWVSSGQDGSGNGVYAQFFDNNGKPLSSEFQVNTYTTGDQMQPDIACLNNARVAITFANNNGQDGSSWGVYMAIFDPTGTQTLAPVQVNDYTTGDQSQPAITVLANGNIVVVYHSSGPDGSGFGICAKIYNPDGTVNKAEFILNSIVTSNQQYPDVVGFSDSSFVVTWQDNSGGNFEIRARLFSSTGTAANTEFLVNTYTTGDQTLPYVTVAADDSFIIGWQSAGQNSGVSGIYFQRYAFGGATSGSETMANTYTLGGQVNVAIASLSVNSFIVTWESSGQDGSGKGVYGQRFTGAGVKRGTEFQINVDSMNDQGWMAIQAFQGIGYVVAWYSSGEDYSSSGVFSTLYMDCDPGTYQYGQTCISSCPTPYYVSSVNYRCQSFSNALTDVQVNTYVTSAQRTSALTVTQDGGYAIVWQSSGQDGSGNGIYAQSYNYRGVPYGSEFKVNSYTTSDQVCPDIAAMKDGKLVLTWQSNSGSDTGDWGSYMAIFTANGTAIVNTAQVNEFTTGDQSQPSITVLTSGNIVICWHSNGQDGNGYGIYCKIYNPDGSVSKAEFIANGITTFNQIYPMVAALPDGTFVVTWQDNSSGNYDIRVRLFSATGTPVNSGNEVLVNTYTTGDQTSPFVTVASDGSYVIAWQSAGQGGYTSIICFQRYSGSTATYSSDMQANTYTSNGQYAPSVASLNTNTFLVTWESSLQDGSGKGVYGQRFTINGNKKGSEFLINIYTAGDQFASYTKGFQNIGYLVTWTSANQDTSDMGVYHTFIMDCDTTKYQYGMSCVSSCPATSYQSSANYRCQACASPCSTCSSSATSCSACVTGFYLSGSTCSACDGTCLTCSGTGSTSCTSCAAPKYLSSGSCVSSCNTNYYADTTTQICKQCDSNCPTCSGTATRCTSCVSPKYLLINTCVANTGCGTINYPDSGTRICTACDSSCNTCTGSTSSNCASCLAGSTKYLLNGVCVTNCGTSYYADSASQTCKNCDSTCYTCTAGASTNCVTCTGTRYLSGTTCVTDCGIGKYGDSGTQTCKTCDSTCYTCTGGTSSNCASCTAGSTKYLLSGACVTNCGTGYYADSGTQTCKNCESTCATCTGGASTNCATCTAGSSRYLLNGACVTNCGTGYYPDTATQTCKPCDSTCYTCTGSSSSNCASCTAGSTKYLSGTSCVTNCGTTNYADSASQTCKACDSTCATCTGGTPSNCASCTAGSTKYLLSGACVTNCGTGYYADSATQTCKTCDSTCYTCTGSSSTNCASCTAGSTRYLSGTSCVTSCGSTNYPDSASQTCKPCDSTCTTCTGGTSSNCATCSGSKYLLNNACVTNCGTTNYADTTSQTCKPCDSTCATCTGSSSSNCATCTAGSSRYLLSSACVTNCGSTNYADSASQTCKSCNANCATCSGSATTCTSCTSGGTKYLLSGNCVTSCGTGYYADSASQTCKNCDSTCATCTAGSSSSCATCTGSRYLLNNACVTNCGTGYYADSASQTCKPCDSTCATCSSSATACTSCTSGGTKYLLNSACVASCGSSNYPDSSTQTCKACDSSCATCSGSATSCASCTSPATLSGSTCVSPCTSGNYMDSSSSSCKPCSGCATCSTSATTCTSCSSGKYLLNSACVTNCGTNYYSDSSTNTCKNCDSTCATCSGSATNCLTCTGTRYLLNSACVTNCGTGNYGASSPNTCKSCDASCATCSSTATTCTSCSGSKYLLNSACVTNCGTTNYADSSSNTCKPCDSTCTTCSGSATTCATCAGSRYLLNSACVTDCSTGYFAQDSTHTCNACDSSCAACSGSSTTCTSCSGSKSLFNSACVSGCGTGNYADSASQTCKACDSSCATCSGSATNCATCSGSKYLLNSACVTDCGAGYYADSSSNTCKACDGSCATCSGGATTCSSCSGTKHLLASSCVTDCANGTYSRKSDRVCAACDSSCATCTMSSTTCTSCPSPKYLQKTSCVAECGSDYVANNDTRTCSSKSGSAATPTKQKAKSNLEVDDVIAVVAGTTVGSMVLVAVLFKARSYMLARRRVQPMESAKPRPEQAKPQSSGSPISPNEPASTNMTRNIVQRRLNRPLR